MSGFEWKTLKGYAHRRVGASSSMFSKIPPVLLAISNPRVSLEQDFASGYVFGELFNRFQMLPDFAKLEVKHTPDAMVNNYTRLKVRRHQSVLATYYLRQYGDSDVSLDTWCSPLSSSLAFNLTRGQPTR